MAVSILGGAAVTNSGNQTTSSTLTIPATVLPGDLLCVFVVNRDATTVPTVTDNDTGGDTYTRKGTETTKGTLFYKRATFGTAGKTITASGTTGSTCAVLLILRGALEAGDPFGAYSLEENISGNQSHAAVTPSTANNLVVFAVYNVSNDTNAPNTFVATSPATLASAGESQSTGGSDCSTTVATGFQTTATSTGTVSWSQTAGVTVSILCSIKPETATSTIAGLFTSYAFSNDASGLTGAGQDKSIEASGATAGTWSAQSIGASGNSTASFFTPSGDPGANGLGSNKTVKVLLNVTTGNTNLVYSVNLLRVNSAGTVQAVCPSSAETSPGATGLYTILPDVTNLGAFVAGDRLRIDIRARNTTVNTAQSFTLSYTVSTTLASNVQGPVGGSTAHWAYGDKGGEISLTNSDLTATRTASTGGTGWMNLRATVQSASSLLYCEVLCAAPSVTNSVSIGLANPDAAVNGSGAYGGADANSITWYADGQVWRSNANQGNIQTWTGGNYIAIATDLTNFKVWFKNISTNSGWNNDVIANQNPATNTGGFAINALGTPQLVYGSLNDLNDAFTLNFGASAYQAQAPSGYINWDGTNIPALYAPLVVMQPDPPSRRRLSPAAGIMVGVNIIGPTAAPPPPPPAHAEGWQINPPHVGRLPRRMGRTWPLLQELPFARFVPLGWAPNFQEPPRRRHELRGAILEGDDGAQAPAINFFNFGWPVQLPQPPHPRPERSAAFMPIEAGIEATQINFFPQGWPAQLHQPQHPRPERAGAIARGDDGAQATFVAFFPQGWPVQPPQPPHPRPERAAAIMLGDGGIQATEINFFPQGWPIAPHQPQHPRPERAGAIALGDQGTAERFINFLALGWPVQHPQPPHPRPERSAAIMAGDPGTQERLIRFFDYGWPVQPWQPPRPRRPLSGFLEGDQGTQDRFIRFVAQGWPVQPWQPPHRRSEKAGAIMLGEPGIEAVFTYIAAPVFVEGWAVLPWQPPHVRRERAAATALGDAGITDRFRRFFPLAWDRATELRRVALRLEALASPPIDFRQQAVETFLADAQASLRRSSRPGGAFSLASDFRPYAPAPFVPGLSTDLRRLPRALLAGAELALASSPSPGWGFAGPGEALRRVWRPDAAWLPDLVLLAPEPPPVVDYVDGWRMAPWQPARWWLRGAALLAGGDSIFAVRPLVQVRCSITIITSARAIVLIRPEHSSTILAAAASTTATASAASDTVRTGQSSSTVVKRDCQ